ncbi:MULTISPECIES: hypothetical protein [Novosphingobium]|nr:MULTISPECIES: hypothetical protein [Novosphingobium]
MAAPRQALYTGMEEGARQKTLGLHGVQLCAVTALPIGAAARAARVTPV